jgi:two-component system, LytTR family, response regulator
MRSTNFTYLVVENSVDVCEGIEKRMELFKCWASLGYCTGVKEAIEKIKSVKPQLIYLDWSLNGGSAFEVLQQIQNVNDYNPYVIFNTGYQSDHPEIPQEIINKFNVDKYLVKPFWENLRKNLPEYIKAAEEKFIASIPKSKIVWMKDETGANVSLPLNKIICIIQHPVNPRRRNFYITTQTSEVTLPITWEKCQEILDINNVNYFITKSREHIVIKDFIEKFDRPYIRLKDFNFKIEVVKEKIPDFINWLSSE